MADDPIRAARLDAAVGRDQPEAPSERHDAGERDQQADRLQRLGEPRERSRSLIGAKQQRQERAEHADRPVRRSRRRADAPTAREREAHEDGFEGDDRHRRAPLPGAPREGEMRRREEHVQAGERQVRNGGRERAGVPARPLELAVDLHPGAFLEAGLGERPGRQLEDARRARHPRRDLSGPQRTDRAQDLQLVVEEGDVDRVPHADHVDLAGPLEPQPFAGGQLLRAEEPEEPAPVRVGAAQAVDHHHAARGVACLLHRSALSPPCP